MLSIGWVQYNTHYRAFLPYSLGLLQAAIPVFSTRPEFYRFLVPRVFMHSLAEDVAALAEADVVAFSLYRWNQNHSLALAAAIKAQNPRVITIFGGPQVPDQAETWLREHPEVDYVCHGPGEENFAHWLDILPGRPVLPIAGMSWLHEGILITKAQAPRLRELDRLPSPYLTGVFEPLMRAYPDADWAGLWETNRGCPFSCAFCDWGSATQSKVLRFSDERLYAELEWFSRKRLGYVFCCDANFGIFSRDIELARRAAMLKQQTGYPATLVAQNAKNSSERSFEIQCILAESGLDTHATLSLQSLYGPALEAAQRSNISLDAFAQLQQRLRARGIHTYTDLIQGLPEETLDSFCEGFARTIESGQIHAINCYIADILPNAAMADPAYRARYGLETVTVVAADFHTPVVSDPDGIDEHRELVIATSAMPRPDWVQARVFAWAAEFYFFKPGAARIPLWLLHRVGGVSIRQMLNALIQTPAPTLQWVARFLMQQAEAIQAGSPIYTPGLQQDGQFYWWGAFEAALDLLLRQGRLPDLHQDISMCLHSLCVGTAVTHAALDDALFLSSSFMALYYHEGNRYFEHTTQWNVWEWYQAELKAQPIPLQAESRHYFKDWPGAPWRLKRSANAASKSL